MDGDSLLIEAGQTLPGPLVLKGITGTPEAPVTITSYGRGRGIVSGGRGDGLVLEDCRFIRVAEIDVKGDGRNEGTLGGCGIRVIRSEDIEIEDVDASGFQKAGISVEGGSRVKLRRIRAHDNGFAGILACSPEDGRRNKELYIGHCKAADNPGDPTVTDNHSGNGILVGQTDGALVEYCEAARNGWDMRQVNWNGPVGIWTYDSDRVVIQRCVSHHNRSPKGDGGGFDLDGGATNCVLQYNYSHDNDGCGYLLCQYPGGKPWHGNVVRFCISENDGRKDHKAGIYTWAGDGNFSGCDIYHCTIFNSEGRDCVHGAPPDSRFRNNIFIADSGGRLVVDSGGGVFQGNCYWKTDGSFSADDSKSLAHWREVTGQEMMGHTDTGMNADPGLEAAGSGGWLDDPAHLRDLPAYRLAPGSGIMGAALDLAGLFGTDAGGEDYYGNPGEGPAAPGADAYSYWRKFRDKECSL